MSNTTKSTLASSSTTNASLPVVASCISNPSRLKNARQAREYVRHHRQLTLVAFLSPFFSKYIFIVAHFVIYRIRILYRKYRAPFRARARYLCSAHIDAYRNRCKDGDNDCSSKKRNCKVRTNRSVIRQLANSCNHVGNRIDVRKPLQPIGHCLYRHERIRKKHERKQR